MKEAALAKKRRGFVGMRNRIPEEEFQLILQGTDSDVIIIPRVSMRSEVYSRVCVCVCVCRVLHVQLLRDIK